MKMQYHWPFLQSNMVRIGMIERQANSWKETLNNTFKTLTSFLKQNTLQIVIGNINNFLWMDFIHPSKGKMFQFVANKLRSDIQYDASCTITTLATKTKRSICTSPTAIKAFDKFSRAASVKHTLYNWRNGEETYLALLVHFISRRTFFTVKHILLGMKQVFF